MFAHPQHKTIKRKIVASVGKARLLSKVPDDRKTACLCLQMILYHQFSNADDGERYFATWDDAKAPSATPDDQTASLCIQMILCLQSSDPDDGGKYFDKNSRWSKDKSVRLPIEKFYSRWWGEKKKKVAHLYVKMIIWLPSACMCVQMMSITTSDEYRWSTIVGSFVSPPKIASQNRGFP